MEDMRSVSTLRFISRTIPVYSLPFNISELSASTKECLVKIKSVILFALPALFSERLGESAVQFLIKNCFCSRLLD